jgi:hypothetical protein
MLNFKNFYFKLGCDGCLTITQLLLGFHFIFIMGVSIASMMGIYL